MFNRRFFDSVRHRLINVMSPSLLSPAGGTRAPKDGLVVFVDYQNFYFFLKTAFEVNPRQVHLFNLLSDLAHANGFEISEILLFTGVPDESRDTLGANIIQRRMAFFRHCGIKVHTAPMAYIRDRKTGKTRAVERGVDVMLASELIKRVNAGASKILLISHDKAFSQSVRIAADVAMGNGKVLEALSIIPEGLDPEVLRDRGIGVEGVDFTRRIGISQEMLHRHISEKDPKENADGFAPTEAVS